MSPTTKNQGGNQADKAKEQAGQAVEKGREAAAHAGESLSSAASAVGQAVSNKASDAASAVSHKASEVAHTVGQKAEDATASVGHGLQTAADKVRENTPDGGVLGAASNRVADVMDRAGHYVEDKNLSGMMDDMTNLIKRNPIPALLLGLGVGFLIGRVLSSRS
jgi:ElaB/YqjD/DUF883 family membrane-anchored ribosome-binding protein